MFHESNNTDRAVWAEEAVNAFKRATGTDDADAISDLLGNLMHLCNQQGKDFGAELNRGAGHYQAEIEIEEKEETGIEYDPAGIADHPHHYAKLPGFAQRPDPSPKADSRNSTEDRLYDMLSRAWEAFDGEEDTVKDEHADLISDMSDLLDELNPTKSPEPALLEFAFDLELYATIRVKASNKDAARNLLQVHVNGAEANLGAWPNGDPILCTVGMPDDTGTLVEIDGEAV